MKKATLLFAVIFALAGCTGGSNIDELISAQELPLYTEPVDIEITDTNDVQDDSDVIVIDE